MMMAAKLRAIQNNVAVRSVPRRIITFKLAANSTQAYNSADEEREMMEKAKESTRKAKETMREGWERIEQESAARDDNDNDNERVESERVKESMKHGVDHVMKENAKQGTEYVAEKAKETVEGAWQTVIGKQDDDKD